MPHELYPNQTIVKRISREAFPWQQSFRRRNTQMRRRPQHGQPHAVFRDVWRRISRQNSNPKLQQFTLGLVPRELGICRTLPSGSPSRYPNHRWEKEPSVMTGQHLVSRCSAFDILLKPRNSLAEWERTSSPPLSGQRNGGSEERKWLAQGHIVCDALSYIIAQGTCLGRLGATCRGTPVKFLTLCGPWFPHLYHEIPAHCPLPCLGGGFSRTTHNCLWYNDSPYFIRFHLNKAKHLFSGPHPPRDSRLNLCCFSQLCPSNAWHATLHSGLYNHFSNNPDAGVQGRRQGGSFVKHLHDAISQACFLQS